MTATVQATEPLPIQEADCAPLRICFIADGRSIHTTRWIRFFSERGHSVALISHDAPAHGLIVDRHYQLSQSSVLLGTRLIKNAIEVRRAVSDFGAQILHAHYINEAGWLGALSRFHPFVLTAWGSDVYLATGQSKLARVLSPWSVRRADYATADSFDQIDRLRSMGNSRCATEMITWGVDLDQFGNTSGDGWRQRHGIDSNRIVILSPRQWIANSNIDVIVEAFRSVLAVQPNALLVLKRMRRTEPDIKHKIETLIEALQIGRSTLIIGELPEDDLAAMYAAADVTVSVCSSDGTPVSMLEAMASRSAVIASNLPSLSEWIEDGASGFLVAPRDINTLAKRILHLISDATLRRAFGQNARRLVEQRANRAANLEKVELAYMRLALQTA